ncbi:MAG: DUF2721 domain-containing protein [Gemmatimonadota bacterium]
MQADSRVFLLSALGATLAVLTNRLARIIDRARLLEAVPPGRAEPRGSAIHAELQVLSRRASLIHRGITLATTCALFICVAVVALFTGALVTVDLSVLIILVFIAGTCAFTGALLGSLRELFLATESLRFARPEH